MQAKEKVLAICYHPLYPVNFGGAVRNFHIIKHLASRYSIYVVCPACDTHTNDIGIRIYDVAKKGIINQIVNIPLLRFMLSLIKKENINIIFQMNIYCGFYALIIHFITGIPFYIDEENVEFIRLRRMGNSYWWLLKIFERIGCHFSKGIFCVSELDKNLISAYFKVNKGKIRVIQNGFEFDKNKYKDLQEQSIRSCNGLESNEKAVLFFGNLYYQPNAEALKIIYNEIVPRIDGKIAYKIWIIGKGAPPDNIQKNRHPRVMLLGEKPDVYPYILASDLIIVPLVSGGGTRIKIIESIAAGKRVLSTSLGAEGIERDGLERNLIVEDDWNEFAKRIIYLLENCHDTLTVTQDFIDRFRWKNIVEKIEF